MGMFSFDWMGASRSGGGGSGGDIEIKYEPTFKSVTTPLSEEIGMLLNPPKNGASRSQVFLERKNNFFLVKTFIDSHRILENLDRNGDHLKLEHNKIQFRELFQNSNGTRKFCGGTFEDLFSQADLSPYRKAREALSKSDLLKKIQQKTVFLSKRRRSFSEHDGEWMYDRTWDLAPFHIAKRKNTSARHLKIEVGMNINCNIDAESISKYGALVWSMNDILESAGISTDIVILKKTIHLTYKEGIPVLSTIEINIKKAGQYVSPMNIAKCLNSNFYRRGVLSLLVEASDFLECNVTAGLGQAMDDEFDVQFEKGLLQIRPRAIQKSSNPKLQEIILKAISP